MSNITEVEDILNRIKSMGNVEGYIITNRQGEMIKSTYLGDKKSEGDRIMGNVPSLVSFAK